MPVSEEQLKALALAEAQLDRQFGRGTIIKLDGANIEAWPSISTGAITLDMALGIEGLPMGRIVEIYGAEGSSKSTTALSVVAQAQQRGMICAYIDAENALDPQYMQNLGVDLNELRLSQPDYAEQALEIVETLAKTGAVNVIVIDSVAALVPKAELEGTMEDQQMGLQARIMGKGLRKINSAAAQNNVLVIFINQLREKVGIVFGNPVTTPGGRALKFFASVRIEMSRVGDIKSKDGESLGIRVKAKVLKNKMAPALKVAEYDVEYGRGINILGCIVDAAITKGIIIKKGSWFFHGEDQMAQGRDNVIELLASDLDLADQLKKEIASA